MVETIVEAATRNSRKQREGEENENNRGNPKGTRRGKLKKTRPERIKKMIKNIFIDIVVIAVILFLVVTGVSMWDRLNWRQFSASGMFVSFILTCLIAAIYFIVKYVWFDFMEYLFIFGIIVILSCIEYEAILFFVYGVFDEIISRWAFIPCLLITTAAMTIFQTLKEEKL